MLSSTFKPGTIDSVCSDGQPINDGVPPSWELKVEGQLLEKVGMNSSRAHAKYFVSLLTIMKNEFFLKCFFPLSTPLPCSNLANQTVRPPSTKNTGENFPLSSNPL